MTFNINAALALFLGTALFMLLVSHYRETGSLINAFVGVVTGVAQLGRSGVARAVGTGGPKG